MKEYPSSRFARWSLVVGDFNPVFEYIKGKKNCFADFLSRYVPNDDISGNDDSNDDDVVSTGERIDFIQQGAQK